MIADVARRVVGVPAEKQCLHVAENRFQPHQAGAGIHLGKFRPHEGGDGARVLSIDGRKHEASVVLECFVL